MEPRPIHNDEDLRVAMTAMQQIWDAEDAVDIQRLADWGVLVDLYESSLIAPPRGLDPVAVIVAEMEMSGRTRADLAALVGQNRATELLGRKRSLTLPMIRRLHQEWNIPAELLIAEYEIAAA